MTPILYSNNETAFTSNGLGRLTDARKCEVTEERNGQYELVMEYPTNGALTRYIVAGNYIKATHDNSGTPQAFQIYSTEETLDGWMTVRAWHISYLLNNVILKPFTAGSCAQAVAKLSTESINTNPFTFWTDKTVTADFSLDVPKSVRAVLGGSEGSLLDTYGKGEYEFDMFDVKLYLNRGSDKGVAIRYGKNLVSLDRELDSSNVYNAVVPYWTNGEATVSLDHTVVRTGETQGRVIVLDLSDEWDEAPTTNQLEAKAQSRVDASSNYELKENLTIDFVQLWQTEEYKEYANLERIYLCDTVHIIYTKRNITASAKCIKVVYDVLRERYSSMELGEPKTTLAQQIAEDVVQPALGSVPSKSMMQGAIDRATELITGGFGGYIKYKYLSDGTPSEMLIMDAPSEATATNIIRLNQNGIGFSTDGGSTYANAWTIDGHLNADFITTGNLIANIITTGLLQDATGDNYWNLDTGVFNTQQGHIGDFTLSGGKLTFGDDTDDTTAYAEISDSQLIFHAAGDQMRVRIAGGNVYFEALVNGVWTPHVGLSAMFSDVNGTDYPAAVFSIYDPDYDDFVAVTYLGSEEAFDWEAPAGYTSKYANTIPSTFVRGKLGATDARFYLPLEIDSGGTGQSNVASTVDNSAVSSISGATIQAQSFCKFGKVAMGTIRISGTIAAGGNVTGQLASGWYPANRATGCGYYSQSPFIIQIDDTGAFTIRNASETSRSPSASTPLTVAVTYILAD